PSVAASRASIRSNTWSRSVATVKPFPAVCDAAGAAMLERVTLVVPDCGTAMAELVSGRSRSGGTSSGRSCGACAYSALSLRNQLQPAVATRAAVMATAMAGRSMEREGCIAVSWENGSGRERIATGLFKRFEAGGDAVRGAGMHRRQRQQRQADALGMAEAQPRQQRLDRDRIRLDAAEVA